MNPLIISLAEGIYKVYSSEKEKTSYPEHLPQQALILFQKFKKAYQRKDIQGIEDTISENFSGDVYGKSKPDFLAFMDYNFQKLKYGLSPHLTIEIYNIATNSDVEFSAVVDMKANLQFAGIVTPLKWDAGKLCCEAKPEGKYKYWRITKLVKFKD
jgi:hypothetical protein